MPDVVLADVGVRQAVSVAGVCRVSPSPIGGPIPIAARHGWPVQARTKLPGWIRP